MSAEKKKAKLSLAEELGIEDLGEVVFGHLGRLFSAAGPESPIVQIQKDYLMMHPPQMPLEERSEPEKLAARTDERGVLLNELGERRKIIGAKFRGKAIFGIGETMPGTTRHYAAWFDESGKAHKLYADKKALTIDMVFRLRNRTHDGELSIFDEIQTD